MPKLVHILIGVSILLCGCSSAARRQGALPPDWHSAEAAISGSDELEHVADAPQLAPPPQSNPPVEPMQTAVDSAGENWVSLQRWARGREVGTIRQITDSPAAFSLRTGAGTFVVRIKNRVAEWKGVSLHLGFEPQLIDGKPFVHGLDVRKNIEPLLQPWLLPAPSQRVVVIDPGHGGSNSGTTSVLDGTKEKEFTLDWARRIERLLATNGWKVFLTRTNDAEVPLPDRVAFAEKHQADLFISLHFNSAAPSQSQSGLETFCLTPTGMSSTLTREYEDNPERVFPNNAFDTQNLQYALALHRALLKEVGADRGVRRARFLGVLRGQNRPAVLLEAGYLSNPEEARRIADPNYRQKLAEAVAAALTQS